MKIGKISNTILNRSVFKNINCKNIYKESRLKAGLGASVFKKDAFRGGNRIVMVTESGIEPVIRAYNAVWAKGAVPKAVQVSVILPEKAREIRLKEITADISADCSRLGIDYAGGHTQVSESVQAPVITATCIGEQMDGEISAFTGKDVKPGDVIAVTKWIGIGGIQKIIGHSADKIRDRYTQAVIDRAYGKREFLSIKDEAELISKAGVSYMMPLSTGGIYGGLWNLSEVTGLGIDVDFNKIPVCQEIIEVCEMFDINPYELESGGCLLMTFGKEYDIVRILKDNDIPVSIIGCMQEGNDKIIRNMDEIRFLDMPKCDEVYKIINS